MELKKTARLRRARKSREHIRRLGKPRLTVFRSGRHIYAQVIDDTTGNTLVSASTLDKALRGDVAQLDKTAQAKAVASAKRAGCVMCHSIRAQCPG